MDCSTPGLPVLHHLLKPAQTHVHRVGDAIQPSHPLSFPSPPAFNLFQHQGLLQGVSSSFISGGQSIRASASASVLPVNIQDWFPLGLSGLISFQYKRQRRVQRWGKQILKFQSCIFHLRGRSGQKIALTMMPGSQESQTPEMGLNSPQSHSTFICHLLVTSTPCVLVT